MPYNYQNLPNRIKRLLWTIIALVPYLFKNKKQKNKAKIITKLLGEYPKSFIQWQKENDVLKSQREITYSLPDTQIYIIYFFGKAKTFETYSLSENLIYMEFPNTFNGIKEYCSFIYSLNPKYMQIHDVIVSGYIDVLLGFMFGIETIFMPRGMNYYHDYVFRKDKSIVSKIRGFLNNYLNQLALKKSSFVNATPFMALESELASGRIIHTSDYLYCQGALSSQLNRKEAIPEDLQEIYNNIMQYEKKIFMFTRVDKMKIDTAIDDYLEIESKLNDSCLVIIGDGAALKYFKEKFKDKQNIFFTGWIDKWDAFPFIQDFDIMLAPHGGYSIIEMGLLGIPTIAYNYDIMSDIIYNRFNGYLIDKETKSEMQDALIEYFSKSIQERQTMKEDIKNSFYKRFGLTVLEAEKNKIVKKLFGEVKIYENKIIRN